MNITGTKNLNVGDTQVIAISFPSVSAGFAFCIFDGTEYSAQIENGQATISFPVSSAGDFNVPVLVSTVGSFSFSVADTPKIVPTISASSRDITVGKDEVITVNVPSDATGKVLAQINGVGYYADIINGKAKIIIPDLTAGNYKATITYTGDDKYTESAPVTTSFAVSKSKAPIA